MERSRMETFPASGKSRLSSPQRPAFPTSKPGSRLLQGKIWNSHRFRCSWLGFLIALDWVTSQMHVNRRIQVSIEDLERKLEKLETACGPPVNLIMLQVPSIQSWSTEKVSNMKHNKHKFSFRYINFLKVHGKNDDCPGRWNFKVVWQLLSMLDLCTLLMSSWRSPSPIVLFVRAWRRFFGSSWEHVIGQLPCTALRIIICILQSMADGCAHCPYFHCIPWQGSCAQQKVS